MIQFHLHANTPDQHTTIFYWRSNWMILYNEQYVPHDDIRISMDDRGYYYGDGIYEVFRIYDGKLFEKEAHMARLTKSSQSARIPLPCTIDELEQRLVRLVELCEIHVGTLYMQITRGVSKRALPFPDALPVLLAYCKVLPRPVELMKSGITAMTIPDIRWLRCDIKSLNLLPNVLAKQEAVDHGFNEAILHRDGVVTECSASNIMIVHEGKLFTHPANHLILHGVTRQLVLKLAEQEGIEIELRAFTLEELSNADEAFLCGTTTEITPIVSINNRPVGNRWDELCEATDEEGLTSSTSVSQPGMITRTLQAALNEYIGVSDSN
jgi:D-alanine transaminase